MDDGDWIVGMYADYASAPTTARTRRSSATIRPPHDGGPRHGASETAAGDVADLIVGAATGRRGHPGCVPRRAVAVALPARGSPLPRSPAVAVVRSVARPAVAPPCRVAGMAGSPPCRGRDLHVALRVGAAAAGLSVAGSAVARPGCFWMCVTAFCDCGRCRTSAAFRSRSDAVHRPYSTLITSICPCGRDFGSINSAQGPPFPRNDRNIRRYASVTGQVQVCNGHIQTPAVVRFESTCFCQQPWGDSGHQTAEISHVHCRLSKCTESGLLHPPPTLTLH